PASINTSEAFPFRLIFKPFLILITVAMFILQVVFKIRRKCTIFSVCKTEFMDKLKKKFFIRKI
ncbi:MAG: hypothetical protein LBJ23_01225, partial [Tannerella sp.]|nr:hypothetical protein [Tannerella sp.]